MRPDPKERLPYEEAAHAVQTGVAHTLEHDPASRPTSFASPKHLRTGLDIVMSDLGGIIELLVSKGVVTDEEVHAAITRSVNIERESYMKRLSEHFGVEVNLL